MNLYQKPKTCLGKYKTTQIAYYPERDYRVVASRFGILICDASTGEELHLLPSPKNEVLSVACSPKGDMIAGGKADNTIQLWDFDSYNGANEKHIFKGQGGGVTSVVFSPDGEMLASGSNDSTIRLWDASDGSHKSTLEHVDVSSVVFSPDGKMLASGSNDGTIRLWESEIRFGQNRCITTLEALDSRTEVTPPIFTGNKSETAVTSVVFSPNGSTLASGYNNGTIHLWNIGTLQNKSSNILEKHTDSIQSLDFSSDGRTLASGSKDKTICIWDTKAAQHLVTLKKHTSPVFSVVFRGEQLVSESSDGSIRFWNTETGENEKTLVGGYISNIKSVVFSPNGQVLASIGNRGRDDTISYFWDVNTGEIKTSITEKIGSFKSVQFSPDSKTLLTIGTEKKVDTYGYSGSRGSSSVNILLWDISTGERKPFTPDEIETFEFAQFSPDSKTLLTIDTYGYSGSRGSSSVNILLWDISTGERKPFTPDEIETFESVQFSPDSKTLLIIGTEKKVDTYGYSGSRGSSSVNILLWDISTGERKPFTPDEIETFESVQFSPDSKTLLTIGTEKKVDTYGHFGSRGSSSVNILLWDISTGERKLFTLDEIETFKSVRLSPDSKTLVCVTASKICFWNIETGKSRTTTLAKRTSNVESIVFSRDSRRLLSVESKTSRLCFWDVETGEPISTYLEEMTNNIESIIFSSDKTKFASVHSDNLIRLWDVDTGKHQSTFEGAQEDITSVAFSLDNRTLACGSRNGMILLWEITKQLS